MIMKCKKCKAKIPKGYDVCPTCGHIIDRPLAETVDEMTDEDVVVEKYSTLKEYLDNAFNSDAEHIAIDECLEHLPAVRFSDHKDSASTIKTKAKLNEQTSVNGDITPASMSKYLPFAIFELFSSASIFGLIGIIFVILSQYYYNKRDMRLVQKTKKFAKISLIVGGIVTICIIAFNIIVAVLPSINNEIFMH